MPGAVSRRSSGVRPTPEVCSTGTLPGDGRLAVFGASVAGSRIRGPARRRASALHRAGAAGAVASELTRAPESSPGVPYSFRVGGSSSGQRVRRAAGRAGAAPYCHRPRTQTAVPRRGTAGIRGSRGAHPEVPPRGAGVSRRGGGTIAARIRRDLRGRAGGTSAAGTSAGGHSEVACRDPYGRRRVLPRNVHRGLLRLRPPSVRSGGK